MEVIDVRTTKQANTMCNSARKQEGVGGNLSRLEMAGFQKRQKQMGDHTQKPPSRVTRRVLHIAPGLKVAQTAEKTRMVGWGSMCGASRSIDSGAFSPPRGQGAKVRMSAFR